MDAVLRLKKGEERRLQAGHLWVFSNEVDTRVSPLKQFAPGQRIKIESARREVLGSGYVNPHSLISARLCSRRDDALTADWFRQRLASALSLRDSFYTKPFYRLTHGEGDLLPGLVIDRFDQVLIVQVTTAGMEHCRDVWLSVLTELLNPEVIYLRNDGAIRELEQLERYQECALGTLPSHLRIIENEIEYRVDASTGQKTGWFYDHRFNRSLLAPYVHSKRVLDCYCYAGAWGLNALKNGADSVLAVDSSRAALDSAEANAHLNSLAQRYNTACGDTVEVLKQLIADGERFDVIVLDPPAFIKRKKDYRAGLNHYALNNKLAAQLLSKGGILVSASCSQPLDAQDLSQTMLKAARKQGAELQLLQQLHQSVDHPINAAMPETRYLKGFVGRRC